MIYKVKFCHLIDVISEDNVVVFDYINKSMLLFASFFCENPDFWIIFGAIWMLCSWKDSGGNFLHLLW